MIQDNDSDRRGVKDKKGAANDRSRTQCQGHEGYRQMILIIGFVLDMNNTD